MRGVGVKVGPPSLAFTGPVQVVFPPTPIFPPGPIFPTGPVRVATTLVDVVGTGCGVTCEARGAQTFQLNQAPTDTLTLTGTYRLHPGDSIRPQNDALQRP